MPFASPFPSTDIPVVGLATHVLGNLSESDQARLAVIDPDADLTLTYGELSRAVDAFAVDIGADLPAGSVIALMGPNSARWIVAYLGALKAGIVITPVTTLATAPEVAKQLRASGARRIYSDAATIEPARKGAELVTSYDCVVAELETVDVAPKGEIVSCDRVTDPSTELAALPYSSGTTALPKGVMLSHRNLVANVCQLDESLGLDDDSVVMGLLPFAHIYGMTVVVNLALRRRAVIVTVRSFALGEFLRTVEREKVTHLPVAPPVMVALGKSAEVADHDLSSVRLVLSGAAPLDASLADSVATRLGCAVRQAYGMTEMSPVSHVAPISIDSLPAESVGLAVAGMSCKLVDPLSGKECDVPATGDSEPGELWCAGPNVMVGYLDNPAATAATLDDEGYLHTGDVAVVNAAGAVTIVDRLKELIKYKGYQVAPAELEGTLLEHDEVADVAVVGDPLGNGDEAPHAYVVRSPGSLVDEATLMAHVEARVAPYKKVRAVTFIESIPKSASGKILRRQLRS